MADEKFIDENLFCWGFNFNFESDEYCIGKLNEAMINDNEVMATANDVGGGGGVVALSKGKKKKNVDVDDNGYENGDEAAENYNKSEDHELHIWTERERRKKMRNMFGSLHALLPHLSPKADKSTIVDEAVKHIRKLEQTLQDLQKQKRDRLGGWNNPMRHGAPTHKHLAMMIQSREAFLADHHHHQPPPAASLALAETPASFRTWMSPNVILSLCGLDAHISVCGAKKPGLLTAVLFVMEKHNLDVLAAAVAADRDRCMYLIHAHANVGSDRFLQAFPVEAIYKQAAAEIMLWINS